VGLLCTSDRFVAETATYTAQNKHKIRISILSTGFEAAITAIQQLQTHALERKIAEIGDIL
jgi:hypothetical protein